MKIAFDDSAFDVVVDGAINDNRDDEIALYVRTEEVRQRLDKLVETEKEMAERTYALDREYVKREAAEVEVMRLRNKLQRAEKEIEKLRDPQSSESQDLRSLKTSSERLGICACFLAPARNCDFRNVDVAGKYDGGDAWMVNWWNAYSGTSIDNARAIVRNGFHLDKTERHAYGEGIYCTPDPETAKEYARQKGAFCHNGTSYLVVIQVRVDPSMCKIVKPAGQGPLQDGEYWMLPDSVSIRPYAICLYKV